MAVPPGTSVISPVLVGRTAHLALLDVLIGQARGGQGQMVLVAGEAGIGKTRLIAETKSRAATLGWLVLQGNCSEPDRTFPYAPWIDLLRSYAADYSAAELTRIFGSAAAEISQLVPELASYFPDLPGVSPLEPEQEKRRLFQALSDFLIGRSRQRAGGPGEPLLIILEDLHWADESSLEFILHVRRRTGAQPVLLLTTYRVEEQYSDFSHFLAQLDRQRLATELRLSPLTRPEVGVMVGTIFELRRPPRPDFVQALHALTEGNPFYIEEVLKSLTSTTGSPADPENWDRATLDRLQVPRSVRDAVARRAEQLGPRARDVLTLAAVAGRHFDFNLLRELTGMSEPDLVSQMKDLVRAQLVVEESSDRFTFRHALTREAVYNTLLRRERKRIHQAVAEALEGLHSDVQSMPVGELAYHFYQAETWSKALEYSQQAGERAQAVYALHAAVDHFTRALEAAGRLAQRPPVAHLYRARGQALETLGEFERARADLEMALDLGRAAGNRRGEWQALLDLGFLWASRDYERTGDYFRQALEAARTLDDPLALAHTLNRVGSWHTNVERPHQAVPFHREALAIFQGLNDRPGLAETFDLMGLAVTQTGDWMGGLPLYDRAIELYRDLGDRRGLSQMLASSTEAGETFIGLSGYLPPVDPAQLLARAEEAVRIAREIDWPPGEAYALAEYSWALGSQGDYGSALAQQQQALAIASEIEHRLWQCIGHAGLGWLYLDLFALAEAEQEFERALALAHEVESLLFIRWSTSGLAACLTKRDPVRAEALLQANAGFELAELTDGGLTQRPQLSTMQRHCAATWVEVALRQENASRALALADALIVLSVRPELPAEGTIPGLWLLRGEALTKLGRLGEAETVLHTGLRAAEARGWRPMAMRFHAKLGRVLQAQAKRAQASEEFARTRALAEALAASIPAQSLRADFLKGATGLVPPEPKLTPRRAEQQAFGGLTERERQVAGLIAKGKSNRAIADALVLSERTVEYHVSRILWKLGFEARSQIASWVVEKGLK